MNFRRRSILSTALFGAGYLGLRSLATGIPTAIAHNLDATMVETPLTLNGTVTSAAKPWASIANGGVFSQEVLDRMTVWHMMTNTPIHPQERTCSP
jgi:hypothetical protein